MNDQSIEFQKIKEKEALPQIVRQSFRIPLEGTQDIWVTIDSTEYTLLDISTGGISIADKGSAGLTIDQEPILCDLHISGRVIKGISGRIVHFSSDAGEKWRYGIEWMEMEKALEKQILNIIVKMKDAFLKDGGIASD